MTSCRARNQRNRPCQNKPVHGDNSGLCRQHGGIPPMAIQPTPLETPAVFPWDSPTPAPVMHRLLAVPGDSPAAERYVTLRSIRVANSDAFLVAQVDGRNVVTDWRSVLLTPDLAKARSAANRLYDRIHEENR